MEGNRRSLDSRIATGAVPRMASVPLEYIAGLGFPSGHKFLNALHLADGATFRKVCAKWTSMAPPRPNLKGWNDNVLEKAVEKAEAALQPPGSLLFLTLFRDRSADSKRTKWWVFDGCHRAFGLTCLLLREERRSGLAGEQAAGGGAVAHPRPLCEAAARAVPVCFVGGGRRHDPPPMPSDAQLPGLCRRQRPADRLLAGGGPACLLYHAYGPIAKLDPQVYAFAITEGACTGLNLLGNAEYVSPLLPPPHFLNASRVGWSRPVRHEGIDFCLKIPPGPTPGMPISVVFDDHRARHPSPAEEDLDGIVLWVATSPAW